MDNIQYIFFAKKNITKNSRQETAKHKLFSVIYLHFFACGIILFLILYM